MEAAAEEYAGPQMAGFKDFYQFIAPTRVIAGRDLIGGIGFELSKEGVKRPLIVTDEVIHATGLIEKVRAGVEDGGLEVAGIYDDVPPDSSSVVVTSCAEAAKEHGADAILAVGGGSATGRATSIFRARTTASGGRWTWRRWPASRRPLVPARRFRSRP